MFSTHTSHAAHEGHARQHLEAACFCSTEAHLYATVRGMGGHSSGMRITRALLEQLQREVEAVDFEEDRSTRRPGELLTALNEAGFAFAKSEAANMGQCAVLSMVRLTRHGALISHVGNSRVYLVREGVVTRLTQDHSLIEHYAEFLPRDEIARYEGVVLRALGVKQDAPLATHAMCEAREGDLLVLCTDGVWRELEQEEALDDVFRAAREATQPAQHILDEVLRRTAARSNIAVVAVRLDRVEIDESPAPVMDFGSWRSVLHREGPGQWEEIVALCDRHTLHEEHIEYARALLVNTLGEVRRPTPTHWLWEELAAQSDAIARPELALCDRFSPASGTRFSREQFFRLWTHPNLAQITELVCGYDTLHSELLRALAGHPSASRITALSWVEAQARNPRDVSMLLDSGELSPEVKATIPALTHEERALLNR